MRPDAHVAWLPPILKEMLVLMKNVSATANVKLTSISWSSEYRVTNATDKRMNLSFELCLINLNLS